MFESKYSKLLTTLLIVGIIIILAVLLLLGFFTIKNSRIDSDAKDAVDKFQDQLNEISKNEQEGNAIIGNIISPDIGIENIIGGDSSSNNINTYKGFPMVGTIEIPAIDLKYPVLQDASKSAMEVSVGIYDGPGLNVVGNTTIAGHNYRDGRFFSKNKNLVEGDKIYITDLSGKRIEYIIYKTYTTSPEDSSYLDRDTQGKREISLTTCTDDAQSRLIIWAKEN